LSFEGHILTYWEFNGRVNRLANALLKAGLRKGDHVAFATHNIPQGIEVYWAAAKAGLVAVPLNIILRRPEIARVFASARVRACIVEKKLLDRLPVPNAARIDLVIDPDNHGTDSYETFLAAADPAEPAVDVDPEEPCTVMFSSGTTSRPKGIVSSHRARALACLIYAAEFGLSFEARTLHTTPLYHNSTLILCLSTLAVGGCVVLDRHFDARRTLALCHQERITHALLVPTQLNRILGSASAASSRMPATLRCLVSVGEPLAEPIRQRVLSEMTSRLYILYGTSEGLATVLRPEQQPSHGSSVGLPVLHTEIRVVGDAGAEMPPDTIGEIVGRSARQMSGYYGDPQATAATVRNGWIYTGDLGVIDPQGFLRVVGRKKEMIISGGVNIYPFDIEQVVMTHDAVAEAAVVGIPDEHWGEAVKLVVALRPGAILTAEELMSWCREQLPGYQRPKVVEIRAVLPRNAAGKLLKNALADPTEQGRSGTHGF
jgi:acyl-CoA synthetase (AMP-forming)/AMP-acid ligase II